jgi:hypothetical protein
MVLVDMPKTEEELTYVAALAPFIVHNGYYHPFFILDDGNLDEHQLWTISHMKITNVPKLLFTNSEATVRNVETQLTNVIHYQLSNNVFRAFMGFDGEIQVGSYEEALWVAPLARVQNKIITVGETTYRCQEHVWEELANLGINATYVIVTNPLDYSNETFSDFDAQFHIPALSLVAPELAAYHHAYVITNIEESTETVGYMDVELNSRAIGILLKLREINSRYGPIEYINIVGSAAAVPQFQFPDQTSPEEQPKEADKLVNSDVAYGFLDEDIYTMDAAVGRIINYNVQGASNQIARTIGYHYLLNTSVLVNYTDGPRYVNWWVHCASFSGYQITYQRRQATPARFWCRDVEDERMEYEYYGPAGYGHKLIGDKSVEPTQEPSINPIVEASGLLAYRGHGSDHGSLYSIRVFGPNGEEGKLESTEVHNMFLPPQIAMFVSCMNAKIHGLGWNKDDEPLDMERAYATNYLYGGAIVLGGSTEVSYSNSGQDSDAAVGEVTGNHKWDLNDAIYAFFWDGVLNHEADHGTVGKALQWTVNRYMNNPNHDFKVSPFEQTPEDPDWYSEKAAHWKESAMFVIYGDPAFSPYQPARGANSYDPWHNGENDYTSFSERIRI